MTTHQWTRERLSISPWPQSRRPFGHSNTGARHRMISQRNFLIWAVTAGVYSPRHAHSRGIYGLNLLTTRFGYHIARYALIITLVMPLWSIQGESSKPSSRVSMPVCTPSYHRIMGVPDRMEIWRQIGRSARVHHVLRLALEYLTQGMDSSSYVLVTLYDNHIRGCGLQTCCCPVARYLQVFVDDGIVDVYDDIWRVVMDDNSVVTGPLPYGVREFIRMFDNGDFPSLIDYNHRHGQLPLSQAG